MNRVGFVSLQTQCITAPRAANSCGLLGGWLLEVALVHALHDAEGVLLARVVLCPPAAVRPTVLHRVRRLEWWRGRGGRRRTSPYSIPE
jgi:hypothetical protein